MEIEQQKINYRLGSVEIEFPFPYMYPEHFEYIKTIIEGVNNPNLYPPNVPPKYQESKQVLIEGFQASGIRFQDPPLCPAPHILVCCC